MEVYREGMFKTALNILYYHCLLVKFLVFLWQALTEHRGKESSLEERLRQTLQEKVELVEQINLLQVSV